MMKFRTITPALALVSALGMAPVLKASEPVAVAAESPTAGIIAGGEVVTAKVISVDQETREVVMEAEDGERIEIVAGPEVRNLAQVKKGDLVEVEYFEALAMELQETRTGIQERVESTSGSRADEGEKPGATVTKRIEAIATVMGVDKEKRLVTLKGPTQVVTVKVGDAVDLSGIDEGDEVKAVYIEQVAISVRAPK